ncbi:Crp/Fnr family transcriptional regulator [Aureibacillus halotolerans]|uniref:CRP-like cAMP-binding protein n=1 Tax=Aureibacillus halotolerans TaxID=1508390 RepID=A0A4R6U2S8_9BACI|nr:Crp/Fnr family transcriptional regulator [Aureibacillus halotolerans]TDQ40660.1 CRP-like cAMP-binding protein [Aureibacillus halotolerans]
MTTNAEQDMPSHRLLKHFIEKHAVFSETELSAIMETIQVATYPKHTTLLKQGEISTACYFVLKGLIRQYSINAEGREMTSNFYKEEQAVVLFNSFKTKTESPYSLTCAEDSVLIVGSLETESSMYETIPALEKLTRSMVEQNFGAEQDERANAVSATPEDRYRALLAQKADLIERVPQHQLASYLGMTPESLSRIKKRVNQT